MKRGPERRRSGSSARATLARPQESGERGEIEPLLLEDLMRRSRVTFAFFLATLVLIRIIAAQAFHASAAVRIALGLTFLLALARWTFVSTFRRSGGDPRRGQAVFIGLTAGVGLGLALINVVAYPLLDAIHASMLGMIQIVINAIALSSMAGSLRIYFLYMLPNLGSFFVLTLLYPRPEFGYELPTLVFLPMPALAAMAVWLHGSLRRNVVLERELRELALRDTLTQLYNRRFLMEFMAQ
ncbi:MAG TPA: hypothetical protein VFZ57_09420, partial [Thermoanaerobaculia bacterium]|nr:hypothetical protein [Thermoanaerobaculia bacterium]